MVKIPDPRFKRYRLRLREEGWDLKENDLFFERPVRLYEFTEYEAEEFLSRSKIKLSWFWMGWKNDRRLEIWGQLVKDDTWVPISPWLLKEQRTSEHRQASAMTSRGEEPVAKPKGDVVTATEETKADAQRGVPASTSRLAPGDLQDRAHAACVEALISKLRSEGYDARPEGTYSKWGERGSVDVYCSWKFSKSPRNRHTVCAIYEVWTEVDNISESLRKLDEKARVFPVAYAEEQGLQRPSLTQAHLVLLATKQNVDVIAGHWETFQAKFSERKAPGTSLFLRIFNPVTAELQTLLPASAGQRLEPPSLSAWVCFPSKQAFLGEWLSRTRG
ncbi:MAG: hypothetical protein Q7R32_03430 [Dehalococcoidia bacterium]|nr:hypothetical protein [Dehalococcoidia bacterium]